jgi:hypothetical protein
LAETFFAGNSLDFSVANFISPAFRLSDPQLFDSPKIVPLKALNEEIRESCARFARQRHSLFS